MLGWEWSPASVQQGCHFELTCTSFNVIRVNSRENLEQQKNFQYCSDSIYHLCSRKKFLKSVKSLAWKKIKRVWLGKGQTRNSKTHGKLY